MVIQSPADASIDASACDALWEHPRVDGDRRYCGEGDCYCTDPDGCWPEDIASVCCDVDVDCSGSGV